MALTDVWQACEDLAAVIRKSRDADALQRVFDRESRHEPPRPHEHAVTELLAGTGMLRTRPLLFGLHAPQLPPLPMPGPNFEDLLAIDGFADFMHTAARASGALLSLIEHIRFRLAGYPDLPVVDLRPESPRVDMDGLLDPSSMPWPLAARNQQLQDHGVAAAGLSGIDEDQWAVKTAALLDRLRPTSQWEAFTTAATELPAEARDQLEEACRQFDEQADPAIIHAKVGSLLLRQVQYRQAALAAARDPLTGPARTYLNAFYAIDRLIDQVATVISERAVYAHPVSVPGTADVSWQRTDTELVARAQFAEGASPFITPGRILLYAGEPPVRGAWIGHGTSMNLHTEMGVTINLDAKVLPDSEHLLDLAAPEDQDEPAADD